MRRTTTDVNGPDPSPEPSPPRSGGRRDRWAEHREQRRQELIAAAVQALLRHGPNVDMDQVAATARGATGEDRFGLRHEFLRLVEAARHVTGADTPQPAAAIE